MDQALILGRLHQSATVTCKYVRTRPLLPSLYSSVPWPRQALAPPQTALGLVYPWGATAVTSSQMILELHGDNENPEYLLRIHGGLEGRTACGLA